MVLVGRSRKYRNTNPCGLVGALLAGQGFSVKALEHPPLPPPTPSLSIAKSHHFPAFGSRQEFTMTDGASPSPIWLMRGSRMTTVMDAMMGYIICKLRWYTFSWPSVIITTQKDHIPKKEKYVLIFSKFSLCSEIRHGAYEYLCRILLDS